MVTRTRNWYARRINKPYEDDTHVYINVYSPLLERKQNSEDYASDTLKNFGIARILDYYGRKVQSTWGGLQSSDITVKNIYFPARNLANPIVMLALPLSKFNEQPFRANWPGYAAAVVQDPIPIKNIKTFLTHIHTAFTIYDQQMNFFEGSVAPDISFLSLSNKIKVFFENVEAFFSFNDVKMSDWTHLHLTWGNISTGGGIGNWPVTQIWLTNSRTDESLNVFNGYEYYFKELPSSQNRYANEIISHFDDIYAQRRDQTNWTKFIYQYLNTAGIVVDHYGTPRTQTVANQAETMTKDSEGGEIGDTKESKAKLDAFLNDPFVVSKGFQEERQRLKENMENTLQKRLDKITADMQEIGEQAELVSKFLKKWRLDALIEAALECLLFKMGYSGPMPDFVPGVDPLLPTPPRLLIRFPEINMKLPIININKNMQAQIEAALRAAAIGAVKSIIEMLADTIRQLCLTEDPETAPTAPPLNELAQQWPNPIASYTGPEECYKDYGLTTDQIGGFLIKLSQVITAREACDLMNGFASQELMQIVNNFLAEPRYNEIRLQLADDATVKQFFTCLGSLVDASYCAEVYKGGTADLNSIDPCDIEEQLGNAFDELVGLLDELEDMQPDMGPCGGIVPPLSSIASYNYSVTSLIDTILGPAQQTFISDLGNFKTIITLPDPYAPTNSERKRQIELLSEGLPSNNEPDNRGNEMLQSLIPSQLSDNFGDFAQLKNILDNVGSLTDAVDLADLQSKLQWSVAPETQAFYENMEANIGTSLLLRSGYLPEITEAAFNEGLEKYYERYAFLTDIPTKRRGNPGYSGQGKLIVYDVAGSATGVTTNGRDIVKIIDDSNPVVALSDGGSVSALINNYLKGSLHQEALDKRHSEAKRFADLIMGLWAQKTPNYFMSQAMWNWSTRKLFPSAYFSLVNLFGYQISTSPLFKVENLDKLNLFPKFCADNKVSDTDLLDVNKIKQEAMQEFVDNACSDRSVELGPVRDAGIMALVNAYLQVVVVDFILKNIFVVSEFGVNFLQDGGTIVEELFKQANSRRLSVGGSTIEYDLSIMPSIVKMGAALYVKKLLIRNYDDATGTITFNNPISGDNDGAVSAFLNTIGSLESLQNKSIENGPLQDIAIRYMFELRLQNCAETVNSYFNILGNSPVENVLIHGLPHVELPDLKNQMQALRAAGVDAHAKMKYSAIELPTDWDLNQDGDLDNDTTHTVTQRMSGLSGSGARKFFTKLGYVERGQDIFDALVTDGIAEGSELDTLVAKADAEIATMLQYGAVVLEKFVKLTFSPWRLSRFIQVLEDSDDPLMQTMASEFQAIEDLVQQMTPITEPAVQVTEAEMQAGQANCDNTKPGTTYNAATGECECPPGHVWMPAIAGSGVGPWGGDTPAGCYPGSPAGAGIDDAIVATAEQEYYVSFETFKRLYDAFANLSRGSAAGWIPIPFSLRGLTARQIGDLSGVPASSPSFTPTNTEISGDLTAAVRRRQGLGIYISGIDGRDQNGNLAEERPYVRSETVPWGSGDDGSNRRALSDYCLIRNWVVNFQRTINTWENSYDADGNFDGQITKVAAHHEDINIEAQTTWRFDDELVYRSRYPRLELKFLRGLSFGNFPYLDEGVPGDPGFQPGWNPPAYPGEVIFSDTGEDIGPSAVLAGARKRMAEARGTSFYNDHVSRYQEASWTRTTADTDDGLGGGGWGDSEILTGHTMTIFESPNYRVVARLERNWFDRDGEAYDMTMDLSGDMDFDVQDTAGTVYIYLEVKEPLNNYTSTTGGDAYNKVDDQFGSLWTFLNYGWDPGKIDGNGPDSADEAHTNHDLMIEMFRTSRTQADLTNAMLNILMIQNPEGDADATATTDPEFSTSPIAQLIDQIFPGVQMGLRLSYLSPSNSLLGYPEFKRPSFDLTHMSFADMLSGNGVIVDQHNLAGGSLINQYSSFFVYNTGTDDTSPHFAHIATPAEALVDMHAALSSPELHHLLQEQGTEAGFSRFLDSLYEKEKANLCSSLAATPTITELFGTGTSPALIDVTRILQYMYISGELKNYFTIFEDAPDIFTDTKAVLVLALQAAFAGEDYAATSECDVTAFQNTAMAGAAGALGGMGQSFINKMLQETPKNILKGLAELTEPHVMVAKLIREVSGQVFGGMQAAEQLRNMTQSLNDLMNESNWGPPPGCEDEEPPNIDLSTLPPPPPITVEDALRLVQEQIDAHYPDDMPPDMKPKVSVKGIDLEGTVPFTFFVPPITPFGVLYLLLRLGQWPQNMIEKVKEGECSERSWPRED